MPRPVRIIRIGDCTGFIIPAQVCRDLNIRRGDYFDLVISDLNTMVVQRLKIVREGEFGEARDNKLPIIKHG